MNTAITDAAINQEAATIKYFADRQFIKEHLNKDFLDALKRMFNYDSPSISFYRNHDGTVRDGQDYHMVMLNAAVRDGQREVIALLENILNN